MIERDFNNSFDDMFDFDHDGKIDMAEQYAEIDFLSGGKISPEDADFVYDHMMHSDKPDIGLASYLADDSFDDGDDDFDDDFDL